MGTVHQPHVTRPLLRDADVRRSSGTDTWSLHPDSVALALELLRALERAVNVLIDSLDVTGFPEPERRSDIALLSHVASGLPPVTLDELVDSLYHLARVAGPRALFPGAPVTLSVPDEARELLYLCDPLLAVATSRNTFPKYAGARLKAAPLAFTLSHRKTATALVEVVAVLERLVQAPLRAPELTTLSVSPLRIVREPTGWAAAILFGTLIFGIGIIVVVVGMITGGIIPFAWNVHYLFP